MPQGTVATVIESSARSRVDALTGQYTAVYHAGSLSEVVRAVRERPVEAVLISPQCITHEDMRDVAQLVQDFPGVPAVAVLSQHDRNSSERLLELGVSGVRSMVDLTRRDGWRRLRSLVGRAESPIEARMLRVMVQALGPTTPGSRRFFESLAVYAPSTPTARNFTRRLGVEPSTLTSRFYRAQLPSPKRFLSGVRLIYAAALLEVLGLSIGDVAYRLLFSSPQSFSRHIKAMTGATATEFRERASFTETLTDFVERLILPFRATFRVFHPLDHGVGDPRYRGEEGGPDAGSSDGWVGETSY